VIAAVLHGRSSGPGDVQPRFDVVGVTTKALPAGTQLAATGHHHKIDGVEGLLVPARRAAGTNPIPFYLMASNRLIREVPAATILTAEMIEPPTGSRLWALRRELEDSFALT
jgi:predicted homoserine dehydrogenase-like protein